MCDSPAILALTASLTGAGNQILITPQEIGRFDYPTNQDIRVNSARQISFDVTQ
ncbi:MAG: hypothetical protein AB7I48_12340 [Planctomycetaceae bacterium]